MARDEVCIDYCGIACVDGSCPVANQEEYIECGIPVVHKCTECHYYEGCEDCAFKDTEMCRKAVESNGKL